MVAVLIALLWFEAVKPSAIGWVFMVAGLAFCVPDVLARQNWVSCSASIHHVDNSSEDQTVRYVYYYEGRSYSGSLTETGSKHVGQRMFVRANPKNPGQHLPQTALGFGIGMVFVVAGPLIAIFAEF
ncbi:MAG: DUF3592 domain-containing protein [Pseudomonadota bacterium]